MKISEIKQNSNNPRIIKDDKYKKLLNSIKEFPKMLELRPIVIDKNNMILWWNMRYKACQELWIKEVPVKIAEDLTPEEEQRFIIEDNVWFWEWNMEMLANNWNAEDLKDWWVDIDFKVEEPTAEEDDFEVNEWIQTDIVLWDLFTFEKDWQELHRLLCWDATKIDDFNKLMNWKIAKSVFTSPPYNIWWWMYETYKDNLKSREYINFNLKVFELCNKFTKWMIFWNISYNKNSKTEFIEILYEITKTIKNIKFLDLVIWDKWHWMPVTSKDAMTRTYEDIFVFENNEEQYKNNEIISVYKNFSEAYYIKEKWKWLWNYWKVSTNNTQTENHKACYPVKLVEKWILISSNELDIILEPFNWSWTNIVTAHQLNRKCYWIELDPIYVQNSLNRMIKLDPNIQIKKNWQIYNVTA
jgi:DNA modification methylase